MTGARGGEDRPAAQGIDCGLSAHLSFMKDAENIQGSQRLWTGCCRGYAPTWRDSPHTPGMKRSLASAPQLVALHRSVSDRRRDSPASNPFASGLCDLPSPRPEHEFMIGGQVQIIERTGRRRRGVIRVSLDAFSRFTMSLLSWTQVESGARRRSAEPGGHPGAAGRSLDISERKGRRTPRSRRPAPAITGNLQIHAVPIQQSPHLPYPSSLRSLSITALASACSASSSCSRATDAATSIFSAGPDTSRYRLMLK
jgi:hypothetical protein